MIRDGKRGANYYSIRTKVTGDIIDIMIYKSGEDTEFVETECIKVKSTLLHELISKKKSKSSVVSTEEIEKGDDPND